VLLGDTVTLQTTYSPLKFSTSILADPQPPLEELPQLSRANERLSTEGSNEVGSKKKDYDTSLSVYMP